MKEKANLIQKHGGYRKLKSYQIAQLIYDFTVRFCQRYVDRHSRTYDQMIQASRSGVQNIAEGSRASGTSKKTEIKLTNVARSSLEELRLDYEDFLRHRGLALWNGEDPRRKDLIALRLTNVDEVAHWIETVHQSERSLQKDLTKSSGYAGIAANAALTFIAVADSLLGKQIEAQARNFVNEGGFGERMYRFRMNKRG